MIKQPRLSVMKTSANPVMIVGILFLCVGVAMSIYTKDLEKIFYGFLSVLGIIFFIGGLVMYFAENY